MHAHTELVVGTGIRAGWENHAATVVRRGLATNHSATYVRRGLTANHSATIVRTGR